VPVDFNVPDLHRHSTTTPLGKSSASPLRDAGRLNSSVIFFRKAFVPAAGALDASVARLARSLKRHEVSWALH